jgi:LacI family transcriptional regulator
VRIALRDDRVDARFAAYHRWPAMSTIRDVAERAGVSTTTVSHVINGTRKVEPATAARVEAAIDELSYRPNALARSMRRGRTHTVGVVIPDIANPFFGDLARSFEDHMYEAGYSAIICNSDGDGAKEARYLEVLLSKQVDGLLLVAASQPPEGLLGLAQRGMPTIVVDRELDDPSVSQVLVANRHGGHLAAQHLLELGHRDIGVIAGPGGLGTSARRLEGFQAALDEAGLELPPRRVVRGDFRAASGRAAMDGWLHVGQPPTAVFAENDLMAIGALSAAHAAGVDVPGQISVVGFDGIAFGADVTPPLTTVSQSIEDMAAAAIELLFERLRDKHARPRLVELPVALAVRGSSGPPPLR